MNIHNVYDTIRYNGNRCCEDNGAVVDRTGHITLIIGMHDQSYENKTNKKNRMEGDNISIVSICSSVE